VGQGQGQSGAALGLPARRRPGGELRLLRQLLRRPAAVGRRPPPRREPRSANDRPGDLAALADRALRRARGCAEVRGAGTAARAVPAGAGAAAAMGALRARRRRPRAGRGAGDPGGEPPLLLRPARDRLPAREAGSTGALPGQEGGLRRPDRRRPGLCARRHPRRPRLRLRRTAARRGRGAGSGGDGGDHAAGHHPSWPRLLRSRAEGPLGCGPSGRGHRCADRADRTVGHRAGLAPQLEAARRHERVEPAEGAHRGR